MMTMVTLFTLVSGNRTFDLCFTSTVDTACSELLFINLSVISCNVQLAWADFCATELATIYNRFLVTSLFAHWDCHGRKGRSGDLRCRLVRRMWLSHCLLSQYSTDRISRSLSGTALTKRDFGTLMSGHIDVGPSSFGVRRGRWTDTNIEGGEWILCVWNKYFRILWCVVHWLYEDLEFHHWILHTWIDTTVEILRIKDTQLPNMKHEDLTAVNMSVLVFGVVTLLGLLGR